MPASGVPLRTPPLDIETPLGRGPVLPKLNDGAGEPVAVTVKEPAVPTVKVVLLPLVIDGGTSMVIESLVEEVELTPAPLAVALLMTVPVAVPETFTSMVSVG